MHIPGKTNIDHVICHGNFHFDRQERCFTRKVETSNDNLSKKNGKPENNDHCFALIFKFPKL